MDELRRCSGLVRRVARLPLDVLEGVTRAMGHRRGLANQGNPHGALHPSQQSPSPPISAEDLHFLDGFERQFGDAHPFFYACPFADALRLAEAESRFVFVYLHDPAHPHTAPFCRGTLCSELATEFLDANFVSWGAAAEEGGEWGEGPRVAAALRAPGFPFCAVVAPVSGGGFAVLRQVEGPVSPSELVDILQRAIEEQGSAFRSSRTEGEEPWRANRRLREEQDAAYLASLQKDRERERFHELLIEDADPPSANARRTQERKVDPAATSKPGGRAREGPRGAQREAVASRNPPQTCQIMVRFPNGERREQSFLSTDSIRSIYRFIDSLDVPGLGSYRLISNFPRRIFGYEQLDMTLREAGLHQRATLFLELLH